MVKRVGLVGSASIALGFLALTALGACSDPASAPAREHASADVSAKATSAPERRDYAAREDRGSARESASDREDRPDPRDLPTPELDGRPMWTATSRLSSEENAARAFEAHGEDFAARDVDAYVQAAHGFLKALPDDVLTLTRANGDKLYYAPGDNVFAVAREDGAPRTLFKPDEGMAYWREQETRESERAEGGGRRDRDQRG